MGSSFFGSGPGPKGFLLTNNVKNAKMCAKMGYKFTEIPLLGCFNGMHLAISRKFIIRNMQLLDRRCMATVPGLCNHEAYNTIAGEEEEEGMAKKLIYGIQRSLDLMLRHSLGTGDLCQQLHLRPFVFGPLIGLGRCVNDQIHDKKIGDATAISFRFIIFKFTFAFYYKLSNMTRINIVNINIINMADITLR